MGDSALHVIDNFDEAWALGTVAVAAKVFDLVLLAVLNGHPVAFDRMGEALRGLSDSKQRI